MIFEFKFGVNFRENNLSITHNERQISDHRISPKPTNYSQHTPRANTGYHSMQEISKTFQQDNDKRVRERERDKSLRIYV